MFRFKAWAVLSSISNWLTNRRIVWIAAAIAFLGFTGPGLFGLSPPQFFHGHALLTRPLHGATPSSPFAPRTYEARCCAVKVPREAAREEPVVICYSSRPETTSLERENQITTKPLDTTLNRPPATSAALAVKKVKKGVTGWL